MSIKAVFRQAIIFGAAFLTALSLSAVPGLAASGTSEIYLANIRIRADILAASDKLVATRSRSDALKRFADDQAKHQSVVLATLDGFRAREDGATPAEVASLPIETGRSVATDAQDGLGTYAPPPGIGVLMAGASATLERLADLEGAAFDESYKATQRGALKALEGLYESYARNGDDDALRGMATTELDAVRGEIAALDRA